MSKRQPNDQRPPPDDVHPHDWQDVERRRESHGRWFRGQQPKPVADVLAQLVQRKGYAQLQAAGDLHEAWQAAVAESVSEYTTLSEHTRVGPLRRGTLEIIVANSLLMQELGFERERLLTKLQTALPNANIQQLRFRVGPLS